MQLTKVVLRNYCQHRSREVQFSPGMTLISGRNGAGKSNLLNAILFALIGEDRNPGKLVDSISAGSSGDSFVELSFQANGQNYRVRRGLRPRKDAIYCGDDVLASGISKTTQAVLHVTGLSAQQLSDYVFVPQRGLDNWFLKSSAERVSEISKLFGLERLEELYEAAGCYLQDHAVAAPDVPVAQLQEQIREAEEQHAAVAQEISVLQDTYPGGIDARRKQLHRQQVLHAEYAAWNTEMEAATKELQDAQRAESVTRAELQQLEHEYQQACQRQQTLKDQYEAAAQTQAAWDRYEAAMQQHRKYDEAVVAFRRAWPEAPELPDPPDVPDDLQEQKESCIAELAAVRSKLLQLRQSEETQRCALCDQFIPDGLGQISRYEERAAALQETLDALSAKEALMQQYRQELATCQRRLAEYSRDKDVLARSAPGPLPEKPDISREDAIRIVRDFERAAAAVSEAATRLAASRRSAQHSEERTARARERWQAADARRPDSTPGGDLDGITKELAALDKASARISSLQQESARLSAVVQTLKQELQRAESAWNRYRRKAAVLAVIREARDILSRNALPRMVLQAQLHRLTGEINSALQAFNAPFVAEVSEDLGFLLQFDGSASEKGTQPDRRLSVGERLMLSWAFRVAINAMGAHRAGLLVLDEPAAGLDAENIRRLPAAVARLKALTSARGLQVLFVSHEVELEHFFDSVIRL